MSAGSKFLAFLGSMFAIVGIFAFMCVTIVPPQTIGIPVTFGKPAAAVGNGLEVRAPWTKIVKMDASIQNDIYDGENQVAVHRLMQQKGFSTSVRSLEEYRIYH